MFLRLLLLVLALGTTALSANIEDHFKKARGKHNFHKMRNIDFIYTINLDKRPEKFASCIHQLRPYGIMPYRFSAINGWQLSTKIIDDIGVKFTPGMQSGLMGTFFPEDKEGAPADEIMAVPGRTYFQHTFTRGVIGCALSHLSILNDALKSGYKTIWVMEDDILVLRNPHLISTYIDKLDALVGKNGWDMLFTDQDTISNETGLRVECSTYAPRPNFTPTNPERFAQKTILNQDFRKIGARYGLYSVIIRRSGIKKILDFIKKNNLFLPIDMEFYLPADMRIFTVLDDIVSTQRFAPTDNKMPGYLLDKKKSLK
jgi:GR25 family glycosyltransferase involved in LPS biosynthesis